MDKPSLLDWAILPLTWLERAKGWKRPGLLLLYLLMAVVVGVLGWRESVVWRLPGIGAPFDIDRFGTVDVSDADNAMVLYQAASQRQIPPRRPSYHPASSRAWENLDWATADPEVRRWVVDNRSAIDDWLKATERPDSLLFQPRDLNSGTTDPVLVSLLEFARLACLESSRLEADGDLAGVWRIQRATLRSSRHVGMHGGSMSRNIGYSILILARPHIERWTEDPRITPEMLRRAIADLEACRLMTSPASEMVRANYFVVRSIFDDPEVFRRYDKDGQERNGAWHEQLSFLPEVQRFVTREPDRSRRILDLIIAGQLAQCDRPGSARPNLASRRYLIYEVDSETPAPLAAIDPKDLEAWADRSKFGLVWGGTNGWAARLDAEPGIFDTLLLAMAERAHAIEHGGPAKTYGDLLGSYLKTLPEGIAAGDLIAADPNPNPN